MAGTISDLARPGEGAISVNKNGDPKAADPRQLESHRRSLLEGYAKNIMSAV
jgi:hypothetical protein